MNDKQILVVDAEDTLKQCLTYLLPQAGFSVEIADNAIDAAKINETKKIDIFLIDHELPDADGFELCQRISTSGKSTNIVMMCECAREFEHEKARALGATACIAKPFTYIQLLETLKGL